jgi:hypothetical protein
MDQERPVRWAPGSAEPVVVIHRGTPGSPDVAECCGLPIARSRNLAARIPRIACPGCYAEAEPGNVRARREGIAEGWRRAVLYLQGAADSWRTLDGRAAFAELLTKMQGVEP